MRLITVGFGVAALLASTAAWAAPAGGAGGDKGNTGGKGGLGPENSTNAGAGGTQEQSTANDTSLTQFGNKSTPANPDQVNGGQVKQKAWEVSATFETHRLMYSQYISDQNSLSANVLFATIKYLFTDNDVMTLGGGFSQSFQADPGESGFRADDLTLAYTHIFRLPAKIMLSTTGSLTAPISYSSQLASNITTPSISVGLSRRFGDLSLSGGLRGTYFWDRYTSAAALGAGTGSTSSASSDTGSEATNPKWNAGLFLNAEYSMPFHRPLSVGVVLTDSYLWYYNVGAAPYNTTFYGATTNTATDNQPWTQSYGEELYVRYIIPDLSGFKSDIVVAVANGDPYAGYPAVLHDGVVHPYLFYYNTADIYLAFEARY